MVVAHPSAGVEGDAAGMTLFVRRVERAVVRNEVAAIHVIEHVGPNFATPGAAATPFVTPSRAWPNYLRQTVCESRQHC